MGKWMNKGSYHMLVSWKRGRRREDALPMSGDFAWLATTFTASTSSHARMSASVCTRTSKSLMSWAAWCASSLPPATTIEG